MDSLPISVPFAIYILWMRFSGKVTLPFACTCFWGPLLWMAVRVFTLGAFFLFFGSLSWTCFFKISAAFYSLLAASLTHFFLKYNSITDTTYILGLTPELERYACSCLAITIKKQNTFLPSCLCSVPLVDFIVGSLAPWFSCPEHWYLSVFLWWMHLTYS